MFEKKAKCPLEEIGRNSVAACIIDRNNCDINSVCAIEEFIEQPIKI